MSVDNGGTATTEEWDVGIGSSDTAKEAISDEFTAELAPNGSEKSAKKPGAELGDGNGEMGLNGANDRGSFAGDTTGNGIGEMSLNDAAKGHGGFAGGTTGNGGGCFNCGQEGHMKTECPNEKVALQFTGECRLCRKEGHRAADCPDAEPRICKNCLQEGHDIRECKSARVIDRSMIPDVKAEVAWKELKEFAALEDVEMIEIKNAIAKYVKAVPDATYRSIEQAFRTEDIKIYLIAQERDLTLTYTNMDFQGNLDRKYSVTFRNSPKPKRPSEAVGWPASPEENLERLLDAGEVVDRGITLCSNCNKLGHSRKHCPDEQQENPARPIVACVHCNEPGHRARDCPDPRTDKYACRNCKQSGHTAKECPEPRSAEGVECNKCNGVGHFAKDCPSGGGRKCNNCDDPGHISKECPLPRDYTRVRCSNCQQMGHGRARCKEPEASEGRLEGIGGGEDFQQEVEPKVADDNIDASGTAEGHDQGSTADDMW